MKKFLKRIIEKAVNTETASDATEPIVVAVKDNLKQRLISIIGFYADDIYEICQNVKAFTGKFPASLSHHEAKEGGLYEHCLEVAFRAAKIMETRSNIRRDTLLAFMTGLFHDIGKIAMYEVDTGGYDYHPLVFPHPDKLHITGTKNNQTNHAFLSSLLILPILKNKVKMITVGEVLTIAKIVMAHHSNISGCALLSVLKEADGQTVADFTEAMTSTTTANSTSSTTETTEIGEKSDTTDIAKNTEKLDAADRIKMEQAKTADMVIGGEEKQKTAVRETKIDIPAWTKYFKEFTQTIYRSDYHYYLMEYENTMIIFLTSPKTVNEINELYRQRTGMMIHDTLFIEALEKNGYIAIKNDEGKVVVKVRMDVTSGKTSKERNLKFICLYADMIFSQEEMEKYATNPGVSIKKVYGQFLSRKS